MSSQPKLKDLTAGLRALHPEMAQVRRWVFITPLGHLQIGLLLDASGDKTIFRPGTVLVPLYVKGCKNSWCFGEQIKRVKLDAPDAGQFVQDIYQTRIAPHLPAILEIEGFHDYLEKFHPPNRPPPTSTKEWFRRVYDGVTRAYTLAALGRFDEARAYVPGLITKRLESAQRTRISLSKFPRDAILQASLNASLELVQGYQNFMSVLDQSPAEIAEHLREIERENAEANGIAKYWQPTPFPFETSKS